MARDIDIARVAFEFTLQQSPEAKHGPVWCACDMCVRLPPADSACACRASFSSPDCAPAACRWRRIKDTKGKLKLFYFRLVWPTLTICDDADDEGVSPTLSASAWAPCW